MARSQYEFEVLVRGKPCRKYIHDDGRVFIEGRKNSEFALRVKNNTGRRAMACVSVDGLSVMDGKEAQVGKGGYIIRPYHYIDIPGWRLTDEEVAKFVFAGNHDGEDGSYAPQMGKPKNVGVIGCAIYEEKERVVKTSGGILRSKGGRRSYSGSLGFTSSVAPRGAEKVALSAAPQRMGTGFGDAHNHSVRTVQFSNKPEPVERIAIFYDNKKGLREKGVDLSQKKVVAVPDPWPGDRGCKPPAGWRG